MLNPSRVGSQTSSGDGLHVLMSGLAAEEALTCLTCTGPLGPGDRTKICTGNADGQGLHILMSEVVAVEAGDPGPLPTSTSTIFLVLDERSEVSAGADGLQVRLIVDVGTTAALATAVLGMATLGSMLVWWCGALLPCLTVKEGLRSVLDVLLN